MTTTNTSSFWETPYRLRSDAETAARLTALVRREPAITAVATGIVGSFRPGERSLLCQARSKTDGTPLIVKLGATKLERDWMSSIQERAADVVPRVFAHGATVDGADVGWLVLERIARTLDPHDADHCQAHVRAIARYQYAARTIEHESQLVDADDFARWARNAQAASCPGPLDTLAQRASRDWDWMTNDCGVTAGHGDAHFDNGLLAGDGSGRLIDPQPRTTVWAWDAAYAQMRHARPGMPDLVHLLAHARAELGQPIPTAERLQRVSTIVLAWAAALWWLWAPWRRPDTWWKHELETRMAAAARLAN